MFSLGCIMAELYTGYPLFPGESEKEQLACIMEILGLPPKNITDKAKRLKLFFGMYHILICMCFVFEISLLTGHSLLIKFKFIETLECDIITEFRIKHAGPMPDHDPFIIHLYLLYAALRV